MATSLPLVAGRHAIKPHHADNSALNVSFSILQPAVIGSTATHKPANLGAIISTKWPCDSGKPHSQTRLHPFDSQGTTKSRGAKNRPTFGLKRNNPADNLHCIFPINPGTAMQKALPMQTRQAAFQPSTLNDTERTVELIWSAGTSARLPLR